MGLLFRPGPRLVGTLALHVALTLVGFAVDRWFVWLAIWAVQAVNLLAIPGMFHECVHGHYFASKWANRLSGTLAGLGALSLYEVYRPQHIHHHAFTCGPDDSEGTGFMALTPAKAVLLRQFGMGGREEWKAGS